MDVRLSGFDGRSYRFEGGRVSDSAKLAFKAIVCAPEFNCAEDTEAERVKATPTIAAQKILAVFIFPPNRDPTVLRLSAKVRPMRGIS